METTIAISESGNRELLVVRADQTLRHEGYPDVRAALLQRIGPIADTRRFIYLSDTGARHELHDATDIVQARARFSRRPSMHH